MNNNSGIIDSVKKINGKNGARNDINGF